MSELETMNNPFSYYHGVIVYSPIETCSHIPITLLKITDFPNSRPHYTVFVDIRLERSLF